LIVPAALPVPAPQSGTQPISPQPSQPGTTTTGHEPPQPTPVPGATPPSPAQQRAVDLSFCADRNQLFTAWNALANLADMAGKVTITAHATSEAGFDQSKLENGVLEPLRETKLID
jgi:hypothetical protein